MTAVSCTWCNDVVTRDVHREGDLALLLTAHDAACAGHAASGPCDHTGPCYSRT
ncbi:hypothetical protein P0L94_07270 [Microbacter sp. GSS18]|nr:hypothetical protein P0L94_07270 [Microbacter sp. GSS18]